MAILYDERAKVIFRGRDDAGYRLPINIRQTAATASGKVWAMRNVGSKTVYVRRIWVAATFDGTPAASSSRYQLMRFRGATPSAGTNNVVIKLRTGDAASGVTASYIDTALTVAGCTFDDPLCVWGNPRAVGSTIYHDEWSADLGEEGALAIAGNDGLAIDLGVAAVVGDGLFGFMEWGER